MEIDGETRCFGLIGAPVAHSLSPYLHNRTYAELGLNCCYLPFHVEPEHLAAALQGLKALGFGGVNVTMPHKEAVLPYLVQLEEEGGRAGSVNTICLRGGRLIGYNTDGRGLVWSLYRETPWRPGGSALILGAGGAARGVAMALAGEGLAELIIMNRTPEKGRRLASLLAAAYKELTVTVLPLDGELLGRLQPGLLVNTLPVDPWDWERGPAISPSTVVCDLRYHPPLNALLAKARRGGSRAVNGLGMLAGQAALSFALFTGCEPPFEIMYRLARAAAGEGSPPQTAGP